jgi:hypothetical protein
MGFDFEPSQSRPVVETWALLCLAALGQPQLPSGFAPSQLALLGFGPSGETTSFKDLREALDQEVTRRLRDPATAAATQQFCDFCDERFRDEMGAAMLDEGRFRALADANKLGYEQDAPTGKVIMLAGLDWFGIFDLASSAAQHVFDAEFQRRFSTRP